MGQIDGTVARPETCTELHLKSDASKVEVGLDLESVGDFFYYSHLFCSSRKAKTSLLLS